MPEPVHIEVDARRVGGAPGESIAAVLGNAGVCATRESLRGEPRGPMCGMGICFECRATVDGTPHERTCVRAVRDTMNVRTRCAAGTPPLCDEQAARPIVRQRTECDVLVIGAGPAGLAAAASAGTHGARVLLLDDNPSTGGQIWRADESRRSSAWRARASSAGARIVLGSTVLSLLAPDEVLVRTPEGTLAVRFRSVVLATGATEFFLPFPGWTLPNVFGVGGLQAMAKSGLDVARKRVVIAGSGPLLLAAGDYLRYRGARIEMIAEQASRGQMLRFARGLMVQPGKLVQGAVIRARLAGVPYRWGHWISDAHGTDRVREVCVTDGRRTETVPCDMVACAFGLVPQVRLAALFGCRTGAGGIAVDDAQRTSVPNVFAGGECTGIGGVDKALVEGEIAGASAAGDASVAVRRRGARRRAARFSRLLSECFSLRAELRTLARPDTIVCRCEDVPKSALDARMNWRDAKLQTRCGMGPCQGRVCGPAVGFLTGWEVRDARPPVFNVPLGLLMVDAGASAQPGAIPSASP